jgi:hypothetical protein
MHHGGRTAQTFERAAAYGGSSFFVAHACVPDSLSLTIDQIAPLVA